MKNIIVLLIAITLFILPVSAEESVFIGDWGVGTAYNRNEHEVISTASVIKQFPFNSTKERSPYYFFQFDWKSNYTYRIIATFSSTIGKNYFDKGYDIFSSSDYTIRSSTSTYDAVTWNNVKQIANYDDFSNSPMTITYTTSGYSSLEVEIVFDNDIVQLKSLDYVILRSIYKWSDTYQNNDWKFEIEAYEDPNNDIYNELILNQLNTISGQLNDILNAGSDHSSSIPSNGPELESTVGNLDRAEQNLYDRSDELLSSVQPQLNNYITQASSSAESFLPVAGFVTNVFTKTKEALPPYVVVLFTVIPLLLFVGWLIGRFK